MGSRIREKPEHLFEVFVEIASSQDEKGPFILQQFPEDYQDKEALAMIPKFAYPCETDASQVDHFTFVLTDVESLFRFGYCRHATGHQTCLCILSCLPWCEVFFKLLDQLASITNSPDPANGVQEFLETTYNHEVPLPNIPVTIVARENMFNFTSPDTNVLPSIPKSRNLTEYFNAVDPSNMMRIFASMVQERRIYMTSKKLSRLTACIHAAEALLYPMHWQHLYIPVLPAHLIDYISAPMPYLIGIHSNLVEKLRINRVDVADAVIVDLDTNTVSTEYDDLENLPDDVQSYLKKSLKPEVVRDSMTKNGDAISVAFLQALVRLIGGYREALKIRPEEPITFDPEMFVRSRPSQVTQTYLESMLALQIFQQFIYGRLEILNSGVGFTDIFEQQATAYTDKLNSQSSYKEWLKSVKKGGRRGREVLSGLKVKAAPMMSGAVNSVKSQGKKAFADIRTKMSHMTDNEDKRGSSSSFHISGGKVHSKSGKHHSTTHSITEDARPKRPPRPPPPSSDGDRNSGLLNEDSQDDSHLRLSYHTVDVSLMGDQDIQAAMMRSASAEVLPKNGEDCWSGSTSTISSDSRSVDDTDSANIPFGNLLSSDDESQSSLVDLPQVGYKSQSSTSGISNTSSDFATADRLIVKPKPKPATATSPMATVTNKPSHSQPPPVPPSISSSSSKPPMIPPRAPTDPSSSSLSSSSSSNAEPLRPPPRKPNASRQPITQQQQQATTNLTQQDAPLIKFESSESEATDSEVFDPLVLRKTVSSPSQGQPGTDSVDGLASIADITIGESRNSSSENSNFQRSSSSRSSLSRSKAFRRDSQKMPLRKGSSFADDENDDDDKDIVTSHDPTTAIFDPLTSLSNPTTTSVADSKISPGMTAPVQARPRRDSSADLMKHEWSLAFLASGPRVRGPAHPASQLPRQSTLPTNPAYPTHSHSQQQRSMLGRGAITHQSSLHATPSAGMAATGQALSSAPYRSRPFSNSPQSSSPFQFIGGAQTNAGGPMSSSRSPSSSPMLNRHKFESSSSSTSCPSSSLYNQTQPSVFSTQQRTRTPSPFGNKSTPIQQQQQQSLLSLSNSSSRQTPMTSTTANNTTANSANPSSNSDPFGDLLDMQFGGAKKPNSSNPVQAALTQQQLSRQRKEGAPPTNSNQQNPASSCRPPPTPKWQTFE